MKTNQSTKHKDAIDKLFADITDSGTGEKRYSCGENRKTFYVDAYCDENAYYIEADLPGLKISDIDIEYMDNYLEISAMRNRSMENGDKKIIRSERCFGDFKRTFYINNIDEDNIKANFSSGVLFITIPIKNK